MGTTAVVGTDASDHGCGELAWIDGSREEMFLEFTRAERRRPINFRELLGVVRLVERWGHRLCGFTLLIDIDNTASVGASRAWFSRSDDMQELVRRLLEFATRYQLTIRPVHTPGAMLHRPDQTSRGAAIEEPRVRFTSTRFDELEARYGPFTERIGAERGSSAIRDVPCCSEDGRSRLWLHPTFSTVATALSRIGERLTTDPLTCPSGAIVVPWAPEAAWWPLTRHMTCVARLGIGSRHLEENREGRWVRVSARRPSAVFVFPRVSGTTLPLTALVELGDSSRGSEPFEVVGVCESTPLPEGSLLYVPVQADTAAAVADEDGTREAGTLYRTVESFDGRGRPACAWLRRVTRTPGRGAHAFVLERGRATARGGSFASAGGDPFYPEVCSLWVASAFDRQGSDRSGSAASMTRVTFDFEAV